MPSESAPWWRPVEVNLKAPHKPLDPDERFRLQCDAAEAADRLQRLAEIGFDDIGLVRYDHTEANLTEDDLMASQRRRSTAASLWLGLAGEPPQLEV